MVRTKGNLKLLKVSIVWLLVIGLVMQNFLPIFAFADSTQEHIQASVSSVYDEVENTELLTLNATALSENAVITSYTTPAGEGTQFKATSNGVYNFTVNYSLSETVVLEGETEPVTTLTTHTKNISYEVTQIKTIEDVKPKEFTNTVSFTYLDENLNPVEITKIDVTYTEGSSGTLSDKLDLVPQNTISDGTGTEIVSWKTQDGADVDFTTFEISDNTILVAVLKEVAPIIPVEENEEEPEVEDDTTLYITSDITIILSTDGTSLFYQIGENGEKIAYTGEFILSGKIDETYEDTTVIIKSGEHNIVFSEVYLTNSVDPILVIDSDTAKLTLKNIDSTLETISDDIPVLFGTTTLNTTLKEGFENFSKYLLETKNDIETFDEPQTIAVIENPSFVFEPSFSMSLTSDETGKYYQVTNPRNSRTEKVLYTGTITFTKPSNEEPVDTGDYNQYMTDYIKIFGNRMVTVLSGEHTLDFSGVSVKNSNTPVVQVTPIDASAKAHLIGDETSYLTCRYVPVLSGTTQNLTYEGFSQEMMDLFAGKVLNPLPEEQDGVGTEENPYQFQIGDTLEVVYSNEQLGGSIWHGAAYWRVGTKADYEAALQASNADPVTGFTEGSSALDTFGEKSGDYLWWNHSTRQTRFTAFEEGEYVILLRWKETSSDSYITLKTVHITVTDPIAAPPVTDSDGMLEPGEVDVLKEASWTDYDNREADVLFTLQGEPTELGSDIIIVVDRSGSMHENSGNSWTPAKAAVSELATSLLANGKNRVALVQFSDSKQPDANVNFKTDASAIIKALEATTPKGNTHYNDALNKAIEFAGQNVGTGRPLEIIFVSDGAPEPSSNNGAVPASTLQNTYGATIHSVGINIGNTKAIEAITNGEFVNTNSAHNLTDIFNNVIKLQINDAATDTVIKDEISQYFNVKRPAGVAADATSFEIDVLETTTNTTLKGTVLVEEALDGTLVETVTVNVGVVGEVARTYSIPVVLKPEYHNDNENYPTNGSGDTDDTTVEYKNSKGEDESKEPVTPLLAVNQGSIMINYALVNISGEYVDLNGNLVDESAKVYVMENQVYEMNGVSKLAVSDAGISYTVTPNAQQGYVLLNDSSVQEVLTTLERNKTVEFKLFETLSMQASAEDVVGNYNGSSYTIDVLTSESDVTIRYSLENDGTYELTSPPEFINATGSAQTVYFQVVKHGYQTVEGSATVNVLPVPLNIFIDDATKVLGEADPAFSATVSGLIGTDTVNYTLSRDAGETVGTVYPINGQAVSNPNYIITFFPGEFTITAAPVVPPVTPVVDDTPDAPTPVETVIDDEPAPLADTPQEDAPQEEIADEETPQAATPEIIEDEETPLASGGAWSLFDLIMTVVAVILALCYTLIRPRKDENNQYVNQEKEEAKNKKRIFISLGLAVMAVFSIILLFITQDFTQPMIVFDIWSIVFAAVALIQAFVMFFVRKKDEEEDEVNYDGLV